MHTKLIFKSYPRWRTNRRRNRRKHNRILLWLRSKLCPYSEIIRAGIGRRRKTRQLRLRRRQQLLLLLRSSSSYRLLDGLLKDRRTRLILLLEQALIGLIDELLLQLLTEQAALRQNLLVPVEQLRLLDAAVAVLVQAESVLVLLDVAQDLTLLLRR